MPDFGEPRDDAGRDKRKAPAAVMPRGSALVTPEEKDELGWENPDAMLNSELQRLAMANREQIYSIVQPYVERTLGRQVEMTGISATYPYQSVNVKYRTVDEPYVAGWEFVALEDDGSLKSEAHIAAESGVVIEDETVSGLYLMAYRDRVAEMREHITTAHPHFTQLPDGYIRAWRIADPMLKFSFYGSGPGKFDQVEAAIQAIYQAFRERPDRTDGEWRELFESVDPGFGIDIEVKVMLRDPSVDLTEDMARDLAEDVRTNPLFVGGTAWTINTYSGLLMRDDIHFHENWMFRADPQWPDVHPEVPFPEWRIDQRVDGATNQSFVDGDPR